MYNDANLLMRHKFESKALEITLPLLTKILEQGKKEHVFRIDNAETTARVILLFGQSLSNYNANLLLQINKNPEAAKSMRNHFKIYQQTIEKMLGVEAGRIVAFDQEFFDLLNQKFRRDQ